MGTVPNGVCQPSAEPAAIPCEADKVRRAEQHHAGYALPCRSEPAIASRGNRSRIDVTGMRRDQCFRYGAIAAISILPRSSPISLWSSAAAAG